MSIADQSLAELNRDPEAIRSAARALVGSSVPVADQGAQLVRTWHGCEPFYTAPETPVLVGALDPVITDTAQLSRRLGDTGRILGRYANDMEPILAQIRQAASTVASAAPATQDALHIRLNALLDELYTLDSDCARSLRGVIGGADLNPIPARVKTGEVTTKAGGEVTVGVIKIGEGIAVVETRFSDGKVMFTVTDTGKLGLTVGLGEKAAGGPGGLTAKIELAPGVTVENGSSWLVDASQADAFRGIFQQYADRQAMSISPDESMVRGAAFADAFSPLPPLPPPDMVTTNFEVPVELKGSLDAAPPGPVDVSAAAAAGLTAKWAETRLKDGSVVKTFGGEGQFGGDAGIYRDDFNPSANPSLKGTVGDKGIDGGTVSVTRDPAGRVSRVVLTSSSEAEGKLGGQPALHKSSTVDVTTTNLAVSDGNRAVVEQWVAQHENDPGVGLGSSSTFYPDTAAPNDPFQNVLHTDATVSRVRYENSTNEFGLGGKVSVGVGVGAEATAESSQSHAVSGTYLDAPDINGHRSERPLPGIGG